MIEGLGQPLTVALLGAFGGILLGLAARLGRFCSMGAIEDALYGHSSVRARMWGLAMGVSMIGVFSLSMIGLLPLPSTLYLSVAISLPAAIVGGLMFGYGMALTGTCGFGAVARLGGGDLRAFVVVLVMGIASYATLAGPLAPIRGALFARAQNEGAPDGVAHLLSGWTGLPSGPLGFLIGAAVCAAMLASPPFRKDRIAIGWSVAVGLAIISGWAGTAWVANVGFLPQTIMSHTYSAPVGESILWAMQGAVRPLSFGIGSVVGVWLGALGGSLYLGQFRWEACEDARELRRQIFGAGLMGVGAVIAMGCTVGQGLSAMSVLSLSAPVTVVCIIIGAAIGLRQLIEGFGPAAA